MTLSSALERLRTTLAVLVTAAIQATAIVVPIMAILKDPKGFTDELGFGLGLLILVGLVTGGLAWAMLVLLLLVGGVPVAVMIFWDLPVAIGRLVVFRRPRAFLSILLASEFELT